MMLLGCSFGSSSESSADSSDEDRNDTIQKKNFYNNFVCLAMNEMDFLSLCT